MPAGGQTSRSVAELRDGAIATVRGVVRRAGARVLHAPSGRACVYWEINDTLGGSAPAELGGVAFWLEDDSGRALVHPEQLDVAARAERRTEAISMIDANIKDVSRRIQDIKGERRHAGGPEATKLYAEHRYLKNLATLLCAIGAHARGNVHVGGTLAGQEAYIRERSSRFREADPRTQALGLMSERYEVALEDGDEIEVTGLCVLEPIPPDLGLGAGYRDTPTCMHLRAPAGGALYVRGLGGAAPIPAAPNPGDTGDDRDGEPAITRRSWWSRLAGWFR